MGIGCTHTQNTQMIFGSTCPGICVRTFKSRANSGPQDRKQRIEDELVDRLGKAALLDAQAQGGLGQSASRAITLGLARRRGWFSSCHRNGMSLHPIFFNLADETSKAAPSHGAMDILNWITFISRIGQSIIDDTLIMGQLSFLMQEAAQTSASCSWLNAVEGFFAKLTRRRLKFGVFHSVVDLHAAINRFIREYNANSPKSFIWKAKPDDIIAARNRGFQTLESIH